MIGLRNLIKKILSFALATILILAIYASQNSNEINSGYFEPYKNKNSTDIMTFSVDNSTYRQGQTIFFSGKVNHFTEGIKVQIKIIDPLKNKIAQFGSLVNRYGIFNGYFTIPGTVPNGKYLLTSYYEVDQNKKITSLSVNISTPKELVYISIPYGASNQGNKLNFDPRSVKVNQGTQITWINNDNTLHSVVSGIIKPNGTISQDDRFASSFITPADTYVISPAPGNYSYFCKIHPWLAGQISIKAIKPPAKPPAKTGTDKAKTTAPFPVSDTILTTIWKERSDLQKLYPEVAKGNLTGMKKWASTTGWNQDKRLAVLIPSGKVPAYLNDSLLAIWKERSDL